MITLLDTVYCSFLIMIHALVSISLKLSLLSDIVFKIIAGAKVVILSDSVLQP